MSGLGYSNGSYGQPLSGYIVFTSPPSYSFSPANPGVGYNLITSIPNNRWHILYGYDDNWSDDWDQWASLQKGVTNTNFRYRVATKPPEPEIVLDLSKDLPADFCYIAKWDDEVRLWIERDKRGLVIPLGRNVNIISKMKTKRNISINMFERVIFSGKEPEKDCDYIDITLNTEIYNLYKFSNRWKLSILSYKDGSIAIVYGDESWDGDKYGYYVHFFI
jgi:hypothetical protein